MALQCLERLIRDVMLDLTSVGRSCFLIYAEADKKVGQQLVTVVHLYRYLATYVGEGDISVLVDTDVAAVFQKSDSAADTGL